ncbi:hypothetical protein A2778_05715 [Candidatus Daviesbacteria bacterium RIFCSPHIGHO2_01_FULL_40_24]|uniref:Uncharacterized protein n=1 Tax=Candidatus Daviesbacteria bacterium GW2011_GWC2_40_12 TaxID=1618431 RepID=A0A0G0TXN7_9BACT|nr:MAG: hypothetical protein UT04_C0071G0003 [Candidatus Daviesbacteria bacterium GW2011_GWF2_38_7]KKR17390.1 MAG: hypothetical protein UT45_C0001G0065 [Candidatus Daviesbacteria bacterium GW2011_GWA2_39_33]KKR42767.1 MAG: hypothetical protein UT77_C0001G0218 [Candidatus Daviesbacteria bacterium GW2011_GWC2_40_12]OGE21650.1 MAG: hypothetical protein A2778_05715 [Candidatus Daviesbacteria bacterium RIFCSPHIGHO2_01_FULL_40_24]OGE30047.1 MAG: hypothetical protein A3C29_01420 [Candidatus Daviesbact
MKLKNVIKSVFEKEGQKDTMHIKALEKQILSKIHEEEDLDQEVKTYFPQPKSFWTTKLPYAFAALLLFVLFFGISTKNPVMAKGTILDVLINLKNQLQQELTTLLSNDPSYRDKNTQKYKQAQKEWCSVSASAPEEQEKSVAAIRDFLDRPDASVEYECAVRNPNKPDEKPQTETYKADFDRFFIDTKTNRVIEMSLIEDNNWGVNKDGSRWFSQRKQYDYTPKYDQAEAEQLANDFIKNHEKSIGKIDPQLLLLETHLKDGDDNKIEYIFIWKGKTDGGFTPQLTITFTQGGQLVNFSNLLFK